MNWCLNKLTSITQKENVSLQQFQYRKISFPSYVTFQSKDPRIGIHESRISSNGPSQRLHRHVHINNNHTILRRSLPNAYILIRLHRHMRKSNELRIDAHTRQLQQQTSHTTKLNFTPSKHKDQLPNSTFQICAKSALNRTKSK